MNKKTARGKNESNNDIHTGQIINTIKAINEILTEIRFSFVLIHFAYSGSIGNKFRRSECERNSKNFELSYESDEDKLHLLKFQLISLPLSSFIFHLLSATRQA